MTEHFMVNPGRADHYRQIAELEAERNRYREATKAAMGYLTDPTMGRGDRIRLAQLALEKAVGGS